MAKQKVEDAGTTIILKPVTLYRSDLEELLAILEGDTNGPAKLQVGDYTFDSLDEIVTEHGTLVCELRVRGRETWNSPHVDFRKEDVWIFYSGQRGAGQAYQLKTLLERNRRWVAMGIGGRTLVAMLLAWSVLSGAGLVMHQKINSIGNVLLLSGTWLLATTLQFKLLPQGSLLYLYKRHEHETFWTRHEENLIRAGLSHHRWPDRLQVHALRSMPHMKHLFIVLAILGCGCEQDRVAKLEEQNKQLSARLDKIQQATSMENEAKCAGAAKTYFRENWQADKDTFLLDYTNHYSTAQTKCFIQVVYNFRIARTRDAEVTIRSTTIYDVYERVKWADFAENNTLYSNPSTHESTRVQTCIVAGKQCKSEDEFKALSRPYAVD
jgi:hypothetical protein